MLACTPHTCVQQVAAPPLTFLSPCLPDISTIVLYTYLIIDNAMYSFIANIYTPPAMR